MSSGDGVFIFLFFYVTCRSFFFFFLFSLATSYDDMSADGLKSTGRATGDHYISTSLGDTFIAAPAVPSASRNLPAFQHTRTHTNNVLTRYGYQNARFHSRFEESLLLLFYIFSTTPYYNKYVIKPYIILYITRMPSASVWIAFYWMPPPTRSRFSTLSSDVCPFFFFFFFLVFFFFYVMKYTNDLRSLCSFWVFNNPIS